MSEFLYDNTGRKFLKCAQLLDEATFGRMSTSTAGAQAPTAEEVVDSPAPASKTKAPASKVFKVDDL